MRPVKRGRKPKSRLPAADAAAPIQAPSNTSQDASGSIAITDDAIRDTAAQPIHVSAESALENAAYERLAARLALLARRHLSWFQSHHFVQVAVGLSSCGHTEISFWTEIMEVRDAEGVVA